MFDASCIRGIHIWMADVSMGLVYISMADVPVGLICQCHLAEYREFRVHRQYLLQGVAPVRRVPGEPK